MPIASFALAAAQMASPVSLDSGFAVNQAMGFQQDAQGNRVVISGTSQLSTGTGGGTQSRLMPSWGVTATTSQATAIGNLVSVTITGNNNTVQLDTTQINLGNQTAIVGELQLTTIASVKIKTPSAFGGFLKTFLKIVPENEI